MVSQPHSCSLLVSWPNYHAAPVKLQFTSGKEDRRSERPRLPQSLHSHPSDAGTAAAACDPAAAAHDPHAAACDLCVAAHDPGTAAHAQSVGAPDPCEVGSGTVAGSLDHVAAAAAAATAGLAPSWADVPPGSWTQSGESRSSWSANAVILLVNAFQETFFEQN
jgi:hypothetical protein